MSTAAPLTLFALHIDWQRVSRFSTAEVLDGLPPERVARIASFSRQEDQYRCAFAGHLINLLYRQHRPGQPLPGLTEGPHGKPTFVTADAPAFNISHSGNWVVGIAGQGPLGIDVEEIRPESEVLDSVLSPVELGDIRALPVSQRSKCFLRLWTLKEARLKAQGIGLSAGALAQLSFRIEDDGTVKLAGDIGTLVYRSFLLDEFHACATCTPLPVLTAPTLLHATDILLALRAVN